MKISRTLKRLRNEKGITQEALAEKLFISRQSVSSWENDRTQPDIEMIKKLAEIFDVSVEELIYGKKRNTALETEKPDYSSTLLVVFSILGSLLAGTGIVLIFVYFWQKLPMFSKAALSFLPLLAGQASGVFVLLKKKDKAAWCEGAGILWTAGIAATLTMIYNIFDIGIYWYTVLLLVTICTIPVILLLRCVTPLAVNYICTLTWFFIYLVDEGVYASVIPAVIFIVAGFVFTSRMAKKEKNSLRSLYSHWLSVAAVITFIILLTLCFGGEYIPMFSGIGSVGLCLLVLSLREPELSMPYRIPGLLLTSVMLFANSAVFFESLEINLQSLLLSAVLCFSAPVLFIFTKRKIRDKIFISYIFMGNLSVLVITAAEYLFEIFDVSIFDEEIIFIALILTKIIALTANILLIISGAKEKKLIPINTGFISVAALTILIVSHSGLSLIGSGLLLLVFGAVLLVINFRISRRNQKKAVETVTKEAEDNE